MRIVSMLATSAITSLVLFRCSGGASGVASGQDAAIDAPTDAPADASGCSIGSIRFRFRATAARYCLAAPGSCTNDWLSIHRYPGGEELPLDHGCTPDCSSCQPVACPAICAQPAPLDGSGTERTWDGVYFPRTGCAGGTQICADQACAPRGHYVARMCAHRDLADAGAACLPSATASCIEIELDWPPETGTAEIAGALTD